MTSNSEKLKHATKINNLNKENQIKYLTALCYYLHNKDPDLIRKLIEAKTPKRVKIGEMDDETYQFSENLVKQL